MQLASYLEGGPLVWMMPLHLHVNQNLIMMMIISQPKYDGSFEQPKHMLKLMCKKIITILFSKILLDWTYDKTRFSILNSLGISASAPIYMKTCSRLFQRGKELFFQVNSSITGLIQGAWDGPL